MQTNIILTSMTQSLGH